MAAVSFVDRLWSHYPIPREISIWSGTGVDTFPVDDLETLIQSCVDELRSDLYMRETAYAGSMVTPLPKDTFAVISANIAFPFQGNRKVPVDFDLSTGNALTRYYPARILYRRYLRRSDLEGTSDSNPQGGLRGDKLQYALYYILWHMAERELVALGSVTLDTDSGEINLSRLEEFADKCEARYKEMKDEIFIYTGGR